MKGLLMLMAGGAGALFFGIGLVLVLAAWGRCEKNLRSQGNKMTRPVAVVTCLALLVVSAFVVQRGYSEYKGSQAVSEAKAPAKSLGFTVAEFKHRFNQAAERVGVQRRVGEPTIAQAGEANQVETFRVVFGDSLGLVGSADKASHAVTDFLVLFVCEDKSRLKDELLNLVTISGVLIEMCNPGVTADQRVGILRKLGLFGGQSKAELRDFDQGKDYVKDIQFDQTRYSFRLSPGGRAYFTAQPL